MGVLYLLFESASGYALFERVAAEEITPKAEDVTDLKKFSAIVKLKGAHTVENRRSGLRRVHCTNAAMHPQSAHVTVFSCVWHVCAAAFLPFESAEAALENINAISEGACSSSSSSGAAVAVAESRMAARRLARTRPALFPCVHIACV